MQVFIYCKITLHDSGVHHTHHQEYIKLTAASGTGHSVRATTFHQRGLKATLVEDFCEPHYMEMTVTSSYKVCNHPVYLGVQKYR